jgi:protein involved in temperature-dependent protein secretion
LGALNAAHASPNALAHASPSSRVGKIAAYKESVSALNAANANLASAQAAFNANPNPTTQSALAAAEQAQATAQANAAQALANAANKSISTASVVGVNSLLGVSLSAPTTSSELAAQAAGLQTRP